MLGITPKEALRGVLDHLEFVLDRGGGGAADAGAAEVSRRISRRMLKGCMTGCKAWSWAMA